MMAASRLELPAGLIPCAGLHGRSWTLADLAAGAMACASRLADQAAADLLARTGRPPSCGAGCGACCRQLVTLSLPEALMLGQTVACLPEPVRQTVEARFAAGCERLGGTGLAGPLRRLGGPALDDAAHYELARGYFALGLACPLLEAESCLIHPRRMAVCRQYLAASPRPRCRDPFGQAVRVLPQAAWVRDALAGVAAQLLGRETELIPLPFALDAAFREGEAAARRWDAALLASLLELHLEISWGAQGSGSAAGKRAT